MEGFIRMKNFWKAMSWQRAAGFDNINIDLMSGIPGQTLESWKNTLKKSDYVKAGAYFCIQPHY